ncbi:MAG: aminomethyl-transferring glycine dehydrogenase [Planctomycetaceae bacterium]|nr:aminomethyl-transferring glycine dehydrogenase [Planctomycetaceae bacterium]
MAASGHATVGVLPPFVSRHIGPRDHQIREMLAVLGYDSLDSLTQAVVPPQIRFDQLLNLPAGVSEESALQELQALAAQNRVLKSYIGQGYYGTHTPKVIQRNVLENPAWYTAYTPYQPEISQGRLEILFYFQTMISELTGLPIANASLLDEGTAAAEAMTLCQRSSKGNRTRFLIANDCHPQTIEVVTGRAKPLQIEVELFSENAGVKNWDGVFGVLLQYPGSSGQIHDYERLIAAAHAQGAFVVLATDLLALTKLKSPASLAADVAVGCAQRFGVPLGLGGPHAAFMATRDELKRTIPGRLVGQSIDRHGNPAYRLSLQTREQHIRREKATSNICTAQALLAIMATLYAMYHGPEGLREIADRVHRLTSQLAAALRAAGFKLLVDKYFDTLTVDCGAKAPHILEEALAAGYNFRQIKDNCLGISLDETTTRDDLAAVLRCFGVQLAVESIESPLTEMDCRSDRYLTQAVFHGNRSETQMMRYLRRLSEMDLALDRAMIPLGSCTMKLNAASELTPVTWPQFNSIHPFAPVDQWIGYQKMVDQLEAMLCEITGYDQVSLQPNAGSQGEYAGLLAIKAFHESRNDFDRDVCLIPSSAHGTNPASAQMANMKVVVVKCDADGNVDLADLREKIAANAGRVAAIMITYPSTHGVFEEGVTEICRLVHEAGGQVYIDGANMNALVGLAKVGKFGGDVSHLNLHKTFCIPHGGGGPGVGPVCVAAHLAPFLPKDGIHPQRRGAMISAAPFGSASILPISWMYIRMMGAAGLRKATQVAILNANYLARRLQPNYSVLYAGNHGLVAHECIVDTRPMDKAAKVSVDDIAKRLIDYGFHAPTMSFPVAGTLMIEPTESEPKEELDRFARAMNQIYAEYEQVRDGVWTATDNPLHNAPHTLDFVLNDQPLAYSRETAVCPDPQQDRKVKYFPPVGRVDNAYGDRNLVCSCPPLDSYAEPTEKSCELTAQAG